MKKEPKKVDIKELVKKRNDEKNKKTKHKIKPVFSISEVITLIISTSIVSLFAGFLFTNKFYKPNTKTYDKNTQTLIDNYEYVIKNYYQDIDEEKIVDAAIQGMIGAIGDPYTNYIDENIQDTFNITLKGTYYGIGLEVSKNDNNEVIVIQTFKDSPAFKAGIQAGDIIKSIDDKTIKETKDLSSIVTKEKNKEFKIKILRNKKELEFKIKAEVITLKSVSSKTIEKNNKKIGYISISIFASNTYEQIKQEIENLEKQNINSLIIDIRGNSGGYLTSVQDVLSLFLDSTHVIYQLKDKEGTQKIYSKGTTTKKYPIAVLINSGSASASEILAITLKEEYNAKLIGDTTYGKNTVQELQTLPNGSQYKVTTKNWLSPKGQLIKGIEPDIKEQLSDEYIKNPISENDNQLKKAIETLENES